MADPAAMVAALRTMLNEAGSDDDDIRTEEFTGYGIEPGRDARELSISVKEPVIPTRNAHLRTTIMRSPRGEGDL